MAISASQSTGQRRAVILALALTVLGLVALACTSAAEPTASPEEPTPTSVVVAPTPTLPPTAEPTTVPQASVAPEPSGVPTVEPLPVVPAVGDMVGAAPGSYVIARPDAGIVMDDGARIVPVYDTPDGPPRTLVDLNEIDAVELAFPLVNPTVFRQPLVLRVIAGTPSDEWLLVQAPVRPRRGHMWVRAEDFVFGQSSLRIEVDLGSDGRFSLFDGERELISNPSVYGRDSRPTATRDSYVEQAFEGSTLSPAYGTYILTTATYSEALGTFGGGGLPGQSLHGTNQPELVGQAVSSGGIRVPNEVIDFVFAQPDLLGASVLVYDSTGLGREAAIAQVRNEAWSPAATIEFDPANPPAVPVTSYS